MNLENYFPVLLFLIIGTVVGVASQLLGRVVGPHRPDAAKLSPYECGFEAFEDARMKFDVRYYLVAILFILFDLETAFFFPWGVSMRELGWTGVAGVAICGLGIAALAVMALPALRHQLRPLPGLVAVAVLWNPVVVVPLEGQGWASLQFVAALVFVVAGVRTKVPTDGAATGGRGARAR